MTDDQRMEFCRMFWAQHLHPFGPKRTITDARRAALQGLLDDMEDADAHRTVGEFNRHGAGLRPLPPRPRWLTAEWLEWKEYAAYDPGYHWNGWACPLVTRAQLEGLLSDHNASAGTAPEDPYLELREDGVLISRYGEDGDAEIRPTQHEGIDEPLYDISLGLCWDWGEGEMKLCPCGGTEFKIAENFTSTAHVCVQCGREKS